LCNQRNVEGDFDTQTDPKSHHNGTGESGEVAMAVKGIPSHTVHLQKERRANPMSTKTKKRRSIYIAGRYSRRLELLEIAQKIKLLDHEVVARWLQGNGK
jgi:hypothetical protein